MAALLFGWFYDLQEGPFANGVTVLQSRPQNSDHGIPRIRQSFFSGVPTGLNAL